MPAPALYPIAQLPRAEKIAPFLCERRTFSAAEWARIWILRDDERRHAIATRRVPHYIDIVGREAA